jgi:hypothetical protein
LVKAVNGTRYYWYVFSSNRAGAAGMKQLKQLYLGAMSVSEADGSLSSFGAVLLWNQPEDESNFQAAWNDFEIPVVPKPAKPPR